MTIEALLAGWHASGRFRIAGGTACGTSPGLVRVALALTRNARSVTNCDHACEGLVWVRIVASALLGMIAVSLMTATRPESFLLQGLGARHRHVCQPRCLVGKGLSVERARQDSPDSWERLPSRAWCSHSRCRLVRRHPPRRRHQLPHPDRQAEPPRLLRWPRRSQVRSRRRIAQSTKRHRWENRGGPTGRPLLDPAAHQSGQYDRVWCSSTDHGSYAT